MPTDIECAKKAGIAAVSASDAIMLGFLDQASLSAVSLAGQVTYVLNLFIMVLVQGTTVLAAQYWGKGDRNTVEKILSIALRYILIISLLFFAGSLFFPISLMKILTNDSVLIQKGTLYLQIAGFSYVPTGISQIYFCIMKNSGKTLKSTVIGSSAMILNIFLNALLIFGLGNFPKLGIQGAAIATALSSWLQLLWVIAEASKKDSIKIRPAYILKIEKPLLRDFKHYTLPIIGNIFFWGGGMTIFVIIIGHMGNDAVAANSIANIVRNIITCVTKGIGTAGSILVGNELGRNQTEKAKLYAKDSALLSAILGVISGLLLYSLRPLLLNSIALTPTAREYLSGMLLICSFYVVINAVNNTVIGGIFCAGGKAIFACVCDAVILWLILSPLASLAAFYWKWPVLAVYFVLGEFDLLPGEGFFANSEVLHGVSCPSGNVCHYHSMVFHPEILSGSSGSAYDILYLRPFMEQGSPIRIFRPQGHRKGQVIASLFASAFQSCSQAENGYEFVVRNLLSEIFLILREFSERESARKSNPQELRIKQMLSWLDEHYMENITISQLAGAVGICVRECQRTFANVLHTTPIQYLNRRRITIAAEFLVSTDMPISKIGLCCGFDNPSYFAKQFKKITGMTPKVYRQKNII